MKNTEQPQTAQYNWRTCGAVSHTNKEKNMNNTTEIEYTDKTVNIAPSRKGTTALLIEIIKNGSLEGRQWAEKELIRITPEEWE